MTHTTPAPQLWLHRYAVAVACGTFLLILAGGLVTSTGSGLAVPDWPLSFGQVFPRMEGGVVFEHGHRMVAATVGLLTVILALWVFRREPRRWVRRLAYAALGAVVLQGVLGGVTVLLRLPIVVSVAHAGLAEVFFCLTTAVAVVTSPRWLSAPAPVPASGSKAARTLAIWTAAVVYGQVLLGALVRHSGAGLAIPDFPLAMGRLVPPFTSPLVVFHFAHRAGAVVVTVLVAWTASSILKHHAAIAAMRRPALLMIALLGLQIYLGALTIWSMRAVVPTTAHLATGALLLATCVILALRTQRLLAPLAAGPAGPAGPAPGAAALPREAAA